MRVLIQDCATKLFLRKKGDGCESPAKDFGSSLTALTYAVEQGGTATHEQSEALHWPNYQVRDRQQNAREISVFSLPRRAMILDLDEVH